MIMAHIMGLGNQSEGWTIIILSKNLIKQNINIEQSVITENFGVMILLSFNQYS